MIPKKRKNKLILGILITVVAGALIFAGITFFRSTESFDIKTPLIKENVIIGGQTSSVVKIKNNEDTEQNFKLSLYNLDGIAEVDENEFVIRANQQKDIFINLSDAENAVGIRIGHLTIESEDETKTVPVIFGVENDYSSFAIIQEPIPNYKDVYSGGKLGIQIKIFNLKDNLAHEVHLDYSLKNFNDDEIILEEIQGGEERVIEDNLLITKIISLPEDVKPGNYVFIISMSGEDKIFSSYFFQIATETDDPLKNFKYLITIVLLFIIIVFWLFFRFFKSRDKIFLKLYEQQKTELKNNLSMIQKYRDELHGVKDFSERKSKLKQLKKKEKYIICTIRKKQKEQRKDLKKLSRKKEKKGMIKQLAYWEKEGYNMHELKKSLGGIAKKGMVSRMNRWKKEGYDFSKV